MSSLEKYKKYAQKIALFNGLTPDEIAEIIKQGTMIDFYRGKTIFHEGQLGNNLFIVFSGEVGIYVENDLIAKCKVGDAFGEMSVLNHKPHSGTAVALSDSKCFVLDERHLNSLLEKHVAVRLLLNVVHILSGYLERTNHRNAELRKTVKQLNARASQTQQQS